MTWFNDVKTVLSESFKDARDEARKESPVVISRGRTIQFVDEGGNCHGDPWYDIKVSKKILEKAIDRAMNDDTIHEICVVGGFDGADSVYDASIGCYDPWIGDYAVTFWTRKGGRVCL